MLCSLRFLLLNPTAAGLEVSRHSCISRLDSVFSALRYLRYLLFNRRNPYIDAIRGCSETPFSPLPPVELEFSRLSRFTKADAAPRQPQATDTIPRATTSPHKP
jgi:hypothetical protein